MRPLTFVVIKPVRHTGLQTRLEVLLDTCEDAIVQHSQTVRYLAFNLLAVSLCELELR